MSQDADHGKRHARKVAVRVSDEHLRGISGKQKFSIVIKYFKILSIALLGFNFHKRYIRGCFRNLFWRNSGQTCFDIVNEFLPKRFL